MLDRNTLTALLLITLVLILTPFYMELISPASQPNYEENNDNQKNSDYISDDNRFITENSLSSVTTAFIKTTKEKIITIENNLYIAKVSSLSGGSVISFEIKDHLSPDSNFVNLASTENKNLLISYRNIDGEIIALGDVWTTETKIDSIYINESFSINFSLIAEAGKIEKTLTFYPESFVIDLEIDLTSISGNILGESFSLGWYGGLPPTEKDSTAEEYFFGSFLYQGGELLDVKVGSGESFTNEYRGQTDWVATRSKYFVAALLENNKNDIQGASISASNNEKEVYDILIDLVPIGPSVVSLYLGPLEYDRIKSLGVNLEYIMNFGWAIIRPISKGILWSLKSMYQVIPNYGVVLIIFSILVKLIVYPLTKRSYESTRAMQALTPELNKIREKHKSNPTKQQQATMKLYKEKGVNPLGSCLPMLLQMPLLIALFTVFRSTIELRGEPFTLWIKDLSAPDIIFYLPFKIPLYGNYVCALPILMAISMYAQQKMMMTGGTQQQEQQKMMQYFMMVFFFLLFNSFPSGLNLYYTLFNVLTIAQQKLTGRTNKLSDPTR